MEEIVQNGHVILLVIAAVVAILAYAARQFDAVVENTKLGKINEIEAVQDQIDMYMGRLKEITGNDPDYNVRAAIDNIHLVVSALPFSKVQQEEIDNMIAAAETELIMWQEARESRKKERTEPDVG